MNRGPTQKGQRQALGEASLPDPQSLLRVPAYPPAAGFDAYYGPFWSFIEPSKQCGLT